MKTRMLFQNRLESVLSTFAVSLFLFGLPARLSAQWTTGTGGVIYYNGGNVGIGTASPGLALDVAGLMRSTGTPTWPTTGEGVEVNFLGGIGYIHAFDRNSTTWLPLHINASNVIFNTDDTGGYVGIGTTSPQHMLQVAGTIGAEQVIVSATGADYVFDPGYRLAPLREVAAYVNANHHLPGIPAAEEMKREGVSVGDMQTKLLAKVEDLTLHMIELEKQNQELKDRLADIEGETKLSR